MSDDLSDLAWDVTWDTIVGKAGPMSGGLCEDGVPGWSGIPISNGARPDLALLAQILRSGHELPAEFRLKLADLFDPKSRSEFKAEIKQRRRGAPKAYWEHWIDAAQEVEDIIAQEADVIIAQGKEKQKYESAVSDVAKKYKVSRSTVASALKALKEGGKATRHE